MRGVGRMKNTYTESLSHTTYECKYHVVFAPKFRRQEIQDEEMGWERYVHRTERLHQYAAEMKEYTQQIREIYQTQITLQQNRVMNFLTVVTTIFMPLTLITGWYGMNFYNMPELHWQYGYICVIIISIVVIIAECIYKKEKKTS